MELSFIVLIEIRKYQKLRFKYSFAARAWTMHSAVRPRNLVQISESALSKVSCSALMKCKLVCFDSELMERIRDETRKDLNNSRFLDFDGSSGDQVPNNFAPSSYRHGQKAPKRVQTQECTEYGSVEGWI